MREIGRATQWQARQLEVLQVRVHLNHEFDVAQACRSDAEVIIVATGSQSWRPAIEGEHDSSIRIMAPMDVLSHLPEPPAHAVVWDHLGGGAGLYTADELAARGLRVSLITPHNAIAETLTVTLLVPLYKRLLGAGARFHVNCEVVAAQGRAATLRNLYTQGTEIIEDVDLLVPWHGNRSVDALSEALLDDRRKVHVIGDSLAPREMDIAVAEGAMIAREI